MEKSQYELGLRYLEEAFKINSRSVNCAQLIGDGIELLLTNLEHIPWTGTLHFKQGNVNESIKHFRLALQLDDSVSDLSAGIAANFVEVLRSSGDLNEAKKVGYDSLRRMKRLNELIGIN